MAKRGIEGAVLRLLRAKDYRATVVGNEQLAAKFLRVHLTCPELFAEHDLGPTDWLRGWFPDEEGGKLHQRGYTLSTFDAATGDFTFDFVLHEPAGPASRWAARAQEGDVIELTRYGSSRFVPPTPEPAGYLILGDAAAIPAINWVLRTISPNAPVELYLEEHDPTDREIPLAPHGNLNLHWVPREGKSSLADAIRARDWSGWYAWATPESGSLRMIKKQLRDAYGFNRDRMHTLAYWVEGKMMGISRDKGE